jgi:hypothetical protein
LCHLQHKLIAFYNPDENCLQRGTDGVFKQSGLRFVFKGLVYVNSCNKTFDNIRVLSYCANKKKFMCKIKTQKTDKLS